MPTHRVYLVRHGKAEPRSDDDAARRLTREGRDRFSRLLRALGDRLPVSRVLTSPLARARETAEILAGSRRVPLELAAALAAGASSGQDILAMAREASPDTALVGHNPELAEAVALAAGEELELKPGAVAALQVRGSEVTLAWLERPPKP